MFYLTMHLTHFIYSYMVSNIDLNITDLLKGGIFNDTDITADGNHLLKLKEMPGLKLADLL